MLRATVAIGISALWLVYDYQGLGFRYEGRGCKDQKPKPGCKVPLPVVPMLLPFPTLYSTAPSENVGITSRRLIVVVEMDRPRGSGLVVSW